MDDSTYKKGRKGEEKAREFLKAQGYEILFSNYRLRDAEVDVIAKDKSENIVVAVEVKSVDNPLWDETDIAKKVNKRKMNKIKSAFMYYIWKHKVEYSTLRLDVVYINGEKIYHYKGAFCE